MELDELKAAWATHGAMLQRSVAINGRLLQDAAMRKARWAMMPHAVWRGVEMVVSAAALVASVRVLLDHAGDPTYVVVCGALAVFFAGCAAWCAYLLVSMLQLNDDMPVVAMRQRIAKLSIAEYHALKWAILGGVLLWLPAALVGVEVLTGHDALARVGLPWLGTNLLFGVIVLVLGQALSRRYVERPGLDPAARRVVDALSGSGVRRARRYMDELDAFERETEAK